MARFLICGNHHSRMLSCLKRVIPGCLNTILVEKKRLILVGSGIERRLIISTSDPPPSLQRMWSNNLSKTCLLHQQSACVFSTPKRFLHLTNAFANFTGFKPAIVDVNLTKKGSATVSNVAINLNNVYSSQKRNEQVMTTTGLLPASVVTVR